MERIDSVPAFIIFWIALVPSPTHLQTVPSPPLPCCWQWAEKTVLSVSVPPRPPSPSKWSQRAFSAKDFSDTLHGLRNRNPVQAQPNPLLHCFFDRHMWNHSLQGVGKGFYLFSCKQNWELLNKQKSELLPLQTVLLYSSLTVTVTCVQLFLMSSYLTQ